MQVVKVVEQRESDSDIEIQIPLPITKIVQNVKCLDDVDIPRRILISLVCYRPPDC